MKIIIIGVQYKMPNITTLYNIDDIVWAINPETHTIKQGKIIQIFISIYIDESLAQNTKIVYSISTEYNCYSDEPCIAYCEYAESFISTDYNSASQILQSTYMESCV